MEPAPPLPSGVFCVVPGLFVSGMPDPSWDLPGLGVSVVASLSDHLPPQAARRFEWGTAGGAVGDGGVVFLHWPFPDGPLPDWSLAAFVSGAVASALASGLTVLVHCQEGRNRSALVAALALRLLRGCSGVEALDLVAAMVPGVFANDRFRAALLALPPP